MIADTSYLIAIDNDDSAARSLSRKHEESGIPQRVPTIAILELYVSVEMGNQPNLNGRHYEEILANLPVVEVDENIARRAGVLLGVHLSSETKPELGYGDALVAATGLVFNEGVITADVDDFGSVDGLDVVTWE